MKFQSFDGDYVRRLTEGDPSTEREFADYFGELLRLKLTRRLRVRQDVEDVRQDTLLRVLQRLRQRGGLETPEGFGAFVNAVCVNVLREKFRERAKHETGDTAVDPVNHRADLESWMLSREREQIVRDVLEELPEKDRRLLRAVFLDEREKLEVCREFGVDRDYLRVLLHRAKERFRKKMLETGRDVVAERRA